MREKKRRTLAKMGADRPVALRARILFVAGLLLVVLLVLVLLPFLRPRYDTFQDMAVPPVTCIMVTGKDASREPLARLAVLNFLQQAWPGERRLLIINHGPYTLAGCCCAAPQMIEEVLVAKASPHATLGALRNLALERVQPGALWAVWDDDDHRRPDYLLRLYREMVADGAGLVTYTDRIEYNANTGLVWRTRVPWGCVHVLARRVPSVRYDDSLDALEDARLIADHRAAGVRVRLLDTSDDAAHYIRVVHGAANTSPYVDSSKTVLARGEPGGYQELPATPADEEAVRAWLATGGAAALQQGA